MTATKAHRPAASEVSNSRLSRANNVFYLLAARGRVRAEPTRGTAAARRVRPPIRQLAPRRCRRRGTWGRRERAGLVVPKPQLKTEKGRLEWGVGGCAVSCMLTKQVAPNRSHPTSVHAPATVGPRLSSAFPPPLQHGLHLLSSKTPRQGRPPVACSALPVLIGCTHASRCFGVCRPRLPAQLAPDAAVQPPPLSVQHASLTLTYATVHYLNAPPLWPFPYPTSPRPGLPGQQPCPKTCRPHQHRDVVYTLY